MLLKCQRRIILYWNDVSHRPPVAKRGTRAFILSCIFLALFLQFGCTVYTQKDFIPVEVPAPVTLFERYSLRIVVFKYHKINELDFYPNFLLPVPDTIPLNTLPIFVIDSVYFEGACTELLLCLKPTRLYDDLKTSSDNNLISYLVDYDMIRRDNQYIPATYLLKNISWWPKACDNKNMFITIHARLLDRATNQTIAQESKRIEYFVKSKTELTVEE